MASISPPTSLATFSQPHASSSKSVRGGKTKRQQGHIALAPVVGEPRWGVAAVQGDGVWTYDLSTLRPTTSFTVPPSTVFTTPAISYLSKTTAGSDKQKSKATDDASMDVDEDTTATSAGVAAADPEKTDSKTRPKGERERVTAVGVSDELWVWKGEDGEKDVVKLPTAIQALHHSTSSTTPLIALASASQLFRLDATCSPRSISLPTSGWSSDITASKVVSSTDEVIRLVIVDAEGKVAVVKVHVFEERAERVSEGWIAQGKVLAAVDISEEGVVTALDSDNHLYSRKIRDIASSSLAPPRLVYPSSTLSLLALPSAGKPLIVLPTPHPTPSLLLAIPLSTLPAVLASTPISSFSTSGTVSHLSILSRRGAGSYTLGVVLSHSHGDAEGGSGGGRSVIYTVEVNVPEKGVGMSMLLGTKEKTGVYLSTSAEDETKPKSPLEESQDRLVKGLSAVLQKGDAKAAEKRWQEFTDKETSTGSLAESFVRRVISAVFGAALTDDNKVRSPVVYAGGIVRDLVQRGVVDDRMWKEGVVVDGLLPLTDWETALLAIRHIPTLTPLTQITLLHTSLHPTSAPPAPPSLAIPLREILALPPPAPTYRLELRRGLSGEDATAILEQYVCWAEELVESSASALKGWDDPHALALAQARAASQHSVPAAGAEAEAEASTPSLQSLIIHSSFLLDAHLPSFLSPTQNEAHALLLRLQSALEPLLSAQEEYRALRAPVQAVLTLAKREQRKREERDAQKLRNRSAAAVGAGKKGKDGTGGALPEEAVGKWKVEDLVF